MNDGRGHDDELTHAERRLVGLLALLRAEPAPADAALARAVIRTVRWQALVRGALAAIGSVGGALAEGVSLVLGSRSSGGRR